MKIHNSHCTPVPYSDDAEGWAYRFADLDGFVLLNSRKRDAGGGRYDIISALPDRLIAVNDFSGDAGVWMAAVEQELCNDVDESSRLAIGFLDFETAAFSTLGIPCKPLQSATAAIYSWHLLQDHSERRAWLITDPGIKPKVAAEVARRINDSYEEKENNFHLKQEFKADISEEEYLEKVARVRQFIGAGDCYQANIAQRFSAYFGGSDFGLYNALKDVAPGDYSAFLRLRQGHAIISLSPERFLSIDGRRVYSQPIKGTAPRFDDPQRDAESAKALLASGKDRAENIMIVDLLRNDLGHFCATGSVSVSEICALYSYDNVHHLVSRVEGELRNGVTAGQALIAASPGGSITGAPKKRAVEIIQSLETAPRGAYCGSIFAMKGDGWLESSIAIRTLEAIGERLYCWGGGGVTWDSVPEEEYRETLHKVRGFMAALETQ